MSMQKPCSSSRRVRLNILVFFISLIYVLTFLKLCIVCICAVKQSVRDVQSMLVFDVHRIFGLAKAMIKGNHLQTNLNAQLGVILGNPVASGLQELRQINSMGDLYVREKFWEESLEVRSLLLFI